MQSELCSQREAEEGAKHSTTLCFTAVADEAKRILDLDDKSIQEEILAKLAKAYPER